MAFRFASPVYHIIHRFHYYLVVFFFLRSQPRNLLYSLPPSPILFIPLASLACSTQPPSPVPFEESRCATGVDEIQVLLGGQLPVGRIKASSPNSRLPLFLLLSHFFSVSLLHLLRAGTLVLCYHHFRQPARLHDQNFWRLRSFEKTSRET